MFIKLQCESETRAVQNKKCGTSVYLPMVSAWRWLCSSRLRSDSADTFCCCKLDPSLEAFHRLPAEVLITKFIYDFFLSTPQLILKAHSTPKKKQEIKQKLDLWMLLACKNSTGWIFMCFSFENLFMALLCIVLEEKFPPAASRFCICWFIIFHLRKKNIFLCKQRGQIEIQTQILILEYRAEDKVNSIRRKSSRRDEGKRTICRKICFFKKLLFFSRRMQFSSLHHYSAFALAQKDLSWGSTNRNETFIIKKHSIVGRMKKL